MSDPTEKKLDNVTRPTQSINDLFFSRLAIQKVSKRAFKNQEEMSINKNSLEVLQKSATIFVSYLLFQIFNNKTKTDKKTLSIQDLIHVLKKLNFHGFINNINDRFNNQEPNNKKKKRKILQNQTENVNTKKNQTAL